MALGEIEAPPSPCCGGPGQSEVDSHSALKRYSKTVRSAEPGGDTFSSLAPGLWLLAAVQDVAGYIFNTRVQEEFGQL